MEIEDYYGVVETSKEIFDKIPMNLCISGTIETVKFLLGNEKEYNVLLSLGLDVEYTVDWYKIKLV